MEPGRCIAEFRTSKSLSQGFLCAAGQHFLAHEDGFPASAALEKGYNRRATLLVYLNDVPQVSWSMSACMQLVTQRLLTCYAHRVGAVKVELLAVCFASMSDLCSMLRLCCMTLLPAQTHSLESVWTVHKVS